MSNATQWIKEKSWREHEKEFRAVSFFQACECPSLDEPDYLGTRRYTAECHPTQYCMAEDSKGWQKTSNSLRLLCHRIPYFLFDGGAVGQKAGQPLSSQSLFKSHEVYSYVEAEDILLLMLEKGAGGRSVKSQTVISNKNCKWNFVHLKEKAQWYKTINILLFSTYTLRRLINSSRSIKSLRVLKELFKCVTFS